MDRDKKREDMFDINRLCAQSIRDYHKQAFTLSRRTEDLKEAQAQIDNLNNQLQEFIEAKTKSEKLLFEKFRLLLNEKKKKIAELSGDTSLEEIWDAIDEHSSELSVKATTPSPHRPAKKRNQTAESRGEKKLEEEERPKSKRLKNGSLETLGKRRSPTRRTKDVTGSDSGEAIEKTLVTPRPRKRATNAKVSHILQERSSPVGAPRRRLRYQSSSPRPSSPTAVVKAESDTTDERDRDFTESDLTTDRDTD